MKTIHGMIFCRVGNDKIDSQEVFASACDYGHGAQNFFFGSVRDQNAGKKVTAVSYDAFEPLAEKVLQEISHEAQLKWGNALKISIVHRTGKLFIGEISVAIGVSSMHRDESYQASRYIIEQIKKRAPIWKKEHYEYGETEWLKGHALCQHADTVNHENSH